MKLKERLKSALILLTPKLSYLYSRRKIYRSYQVINDMSISGDAEIKYDPRGVYLTMPAVPNKYYHRIMQKRTFDEVGIPVFDGGKHNIVTIAQYGLSEFGYYISTKKEIHLSRAEKVCDWLLETQDEETGCWYNNFSFYHKAADCTLDHWASAMGQGEAASLLTRMWYINRDDRLLDAAVKAFRMFDVPVSEGGLLAKFHDAWIYEEYPTERPSVTLNGMIFAVMGLYDTMLASKDKRIASLWEKGMEAIEYIVPFFDDDVESSYDLSHITVRARPRVRGGKYHYIHITQLQNLQSVYPCAVFAYYIKKWAAICGVKIKVNSNS